MPMLPGTQIEIVRNVTRGAVRHALFDFDGTLSLIRQGWQDVMGPMMVEALLQTPQHESRPEVERLVRDLIDTTTGIQTIYQMIRLTEEIRARGGEPLEATEYKRRYLELLWEHIAHRVEGLRRGETPREDLLVPGAVEMLEALCARDVVCYLASGTDLVYVQDEAEALGLAGYFGGGIYGALENWEDFTKAKLITRILQEHALRGPELVTFGDGFVEIENTVDVGGIAVGVATDEERLCGVSAWKRERLMRAGAHLIIPDLREYEALLRYLCTEEA